MIYYAFTAFLNFITSIVIGLLVLLKDRKNKINFSFFLFSFSIAFWSLGYCFWQLSNTPEAALFWTHFLMLGAGYIPVTYLHFVYNFLDLKRNIMVILGYIFFTVFIPFNYTKLFIAGLNPYIGVNYWPIAGPFFSVFLIVWSFYVLYATILLFKEYGKSEGIRKEQIKVLLYGIVFGFICGSTNFFAWYSIPFPPIFNLFVSAYVVATAYSIVRYKSFNVKMFGAQVFVWSLVIIIGSEFLFVSENISKILIAITLVISGGIGLLLVRSVKKEIELRDKLQMANEGQTNLIHIMNHQIKGYLTVHKNIFAELLTDDYGKIPKGAKEIIEKGMDSADKGAKYVTDILRGASAENGVISYDSKEIDFKEIVLDKINSLKELVEKKGLKLETDINNADYKMIGDGLQLAEAVRNLIENSLNYTIYGLINIKLEKKDNKILFSVKDTGIGIRESDRDKIFKAGGVSDDSIKINVNSSGYGLVFVKGVVEKHNGKIWFESEGRNKGTTFFVELPIK